MNYQLYKAYKINPEFADSDNETDVFYLSSFNADTAENQGGLYFHRMVGGTFYADESSWFNLVELEDGVLVEA